MIYPLIIIFVILYSTSALENSTVAEGKSDGFFYLRSPLESNDGDKTKLYCTYLD